MTRINKPIALAGLLSTITIFLHVVGGGAEILHPLQQAGLPEFLTTFVTLLWHGVTVTLTTCSAALFIAAIRAPLRRPLVLMVTAQYLALTGLFLFYGLTQLGNLTQMPQWTIFVVISATALLGLRTASHHTTTPLTTPPSPSPTNRASTATEAPSSRLKALTSRT